MQRAVPDLVRRPARAALSRLGLAIGMAVAGLGMLAHDADALSACRSDPVLVVNGATVDVVSTLYTTASTIRELDYTVTVPAGSVIGQTTLTAGLGFPEKVTYVFSKTQTRGTMRIAATVQTQAGVAPFATTVQASSLLSASQASGTSNSTVTVNLGNLVML